MSEEISSRSTKAELEQYAADNDIDLSGAATNAEKWAVIEASLPDEGTEDDETDPVASGDPNTELPEVTRLDEHLDAPSTTAPGDGPADTTDPTERASSASPDKGAAAIAGHGTVNAVVPLPKRPRAKAKAKDDERIERYEQEKPDGTLVHVERNIETGATKVLGPVG